MVVHADTISISNCMYRCIQQLLTFFTGAVPFGGSPRFFLIGYHPKDFRYCIPASAGMTIECKCLSFLRKQESSD